MKIRKREIIKTGEKAKYIRTKDGIYNVDNLYICEELNDKPYATKNNGLCIYKESITKQANTIEDLCDRFIVYSEDLRNFVVNDYMPTPIKGCDIYGTIRTDKGLIKVAKMNDKGELELL